MAPRKKSQEFIRPIDVRPGDLITTQGHPQGVTVVDSYLVEAGTRIGRGMAQDRVRKPEWWVKILYTDHQGRVQTQTQRFKTGKFAEKCIERHVWDHTDSSTIREAT